MKERELASIVAAIIMNGLDSNPQAGGCSTHLAAELALELIAEVDEELKKDV